MITSLGAFLDRQPLAVLRNYAGLTGAIRTGYDRGARFAVVEFASWSLAQGYAAAWPCRVAVFTNLTPEHFDIHGSWERYVASKAQLFASLPANGIGILNAADQMSEVLRAAMPRTARAIYYGCSLRGAFHTPPDFEVSDIRLDLSGTHFAVRLRESAHQRIPVHIRAIGHPFAENATAALAAAVAAEVPLQRAITAIEAAAPPPGRFEILSTNPSIVLDFAHTPDALARTLATARALGRQRVLLVFGAGGDRDRLKRPLLGTAARSADAIYVTSDNPRTEDPAAIIDDVYTGLGGHPRSCKVVDRRRAIEQAFSEMSEADILVLAGRGPETHQHIGDAWVPMSDAEIIRECLQRSRGP